MAEKILIASGKGGVGKSTFSAFFGKHVANCGFKVLLIDADSGLGALDILLGVAENTVNSWLDVVNGNCKIENALMQVTSNLHLLVSPSFFSEDLSSDVLRSVVGMCEDDYDYIFIDASAGIDANLKMTALACDRAVFIATADEVSVKCAAAAAKTVLQYGIDSDGMRLVINRFNKKAALKSKLLNVDGVIDKSGVMLLGVLPEDKRIPFMSVSNVLPDKKSSFASSIERIFLRLQGENVPLKLNKLK